MSETVWRRNDNWVGSQIEDAYVMLNFDGGEYVSLNRTATDIWNVLETPNNASQIVKTLIANYNISEDQCAKSVDRLLVELKAKGLISPNT
jgi:Coenzyme PQQ synthesis protein D (PqqD)